NGSNHAATGWAKVTVTVWSSTASMLSMMLQTSALTEALEGFVTHSQVKTTSLAVNGSPSDHRTPSFNLKVTEVRSSDSWPFSTDGTSAARTGMSAASWL